MADRPMLDFTEAIGRILLVTECRTQQELADFLGIRQSSISDAKKRGSLPAEWLLTILRKKWVNPEWVLTGRGTRFLQPAEDAEAPGSEAINKLEIRPPGDCSAQELINELVRRAMLAF